MTDELKQQRDDFIMPQASYRGEFTPENLVFDANLQEFANRVSLICGLETGGKLSANEAYEQIKTLWKGLETSKQNLFQDKQADDPDNWEH